MTRRFPVFVLLCLLLPGIAAQAGAARAEEPEWTARVLKVLVTRRSGVGELGSAVPLAGERLVTNCHVLRDALRIEIEQGGEMRLAKAELGDGYRDLCFLTVPGLRADPMPMIEVGATRVGLEVVAVGYPGGSFATTTGKIIGLHTCECDDGRVIQTSAPFDRGASGGGLFDRQGRLVGILTFKAKAGGNFHFALPVGWLRHLTERHPVAGDGSFWEQPGRESGYFLVACDLGAKQDWRALNRLAGEWSEQEPNNPEAWMALGRASLGQRQLEAAAQSFQHVLMLDSTHAEAKWALQKLEMELGRSLLDRTGL